jgi:hypothetical protein
MRHWVLALSLLFLLGGTVAWAPGPTPEPVKKSKRVKTAIAWKVTPADVVIFLDGKKLGTAGDIKETRTRPGMHAVKLVRGGDETEMDVKVNKGHVLTFTFEFTD